MHTNFWKYIIHDHSGITTKVGRGLTFKYALALMIHPLKVRTTGAMRAQTSARHTRSTASLLHKNS